MSANATNFDRKSGVAQWRDLRFLLAGSPVVSTCATRLTALTALTAHIFAASPWPHLW